MRPDFGDAHSDPICPYCGATESDAWEIPTDADEYDCGTCERRVLLRQDFSRYFATAKVPEAPDEVPR